MAILLEVPSPTASWSELCAGLDSHIPALSHLAPAEKVVARYLMEGLTNREIAIALGKAEATVKNQVSACLRKCNVSSRGRLVALMR
jgi:DNA-binding NarL/FixJ family response regulator